jgi:YVTN family beta-propeller protein
VRAELPRELDTVSARALAKEPGRRYRSAGELVQATRSALRLVDAAPSERKPARLLLVAASLALAAAAALVALLLTRDSGGLSSVSPNSVGVIDPDSNTLVAEVPVGIDPEGIALGEDAAWVANSTDGTISRIDRTGLRVSRTLPLDDDGYPTGVAVADGVLWAPVTESDVETEGRHTLRPYGRNPGFAGDAFIARIDWFGEDTGTRIGSIPMSGLICGPAAMVAVATEAVWFGCDTFLSRLDPTRGSERTRLVRLPASDVSKWFTDVAFGADSVWLANRAANSVTEIDPGSLRQVREIPVGEAPTAVAVGFGSVWVTTLEDDTVWRIEVPGAGEADVLKPISVGDGPVDIAVGDDAVWVVNSLDGTVSRIDPAKNEVVATVEVGNQPRRIAVDDDGVWVTVRGPVGLGPAEPQGSDG